MAEVQTDLSPIDLLRTLERVEQEMGRSLGERWGPRDIDLDLLLYDDEVVEEPGLLVPHPELSRRAFVLVPLLEIAPDLLLPSGERLADFPVDRSGVRLYQPRG